MPGLVGKNISISDGLEGQDDHFETISSLWEELQLCAVDIATNPECDVLSFSQSAFFLGIITVNRELEAHQVASAGPNIQSSMFDRPSHSAQPPRSSVEDLGANRASLWMDNRDTYDAWDPVPGGAYCVTPFPVGMKKQMKKQRVGIAERRGGSLLGSSTRQNVLEEGYGKDDSPTTQWTSRPHSTTASSPILQSSGYQSTNTHLAPQTSGYDASIGQKGSPSTWFNPLPRHEMRDELVKAVEAEASKTIIGLIYLAASPLAPSPPDQVGELNLGIILAAPHRGKGYAREAIQLALKHAFDVRRCHRIQASLLHSSTKDRMISLLTHMRFGHEGTKRRAFFNPMIAEWQDVTTLALIDTDWAMRRLYKSAPKSLWDELFLRHERERDELLHWEESQGRLKRGITSSMETLRDLPLEMDSGNASDATASSSTSVSKGKKRARSTSQGDPYDGSNSDTDSEFGDTMFIRRYTPDSEGQRSGASSPALSDASLESVPNSVTTTGFGSEWDMFDLSSGSSSLGDDE